MDKNKYIEGFVVNFREDYMTEKWIYSEDSTNDKLIFLGYDVDLYPLTCFSLRKETLLKELVLSKALEITEDFKGEVWLDDVIVKCPKIKQ